VGITVLMLAPNIGCTAAGAARPEHGVKRQIRTQPKNMRVSAKFPGLEPPTPDAQFFG
jgi:hypothetical protein